ncbi:MAG: DUF2656 domain-containing protein [Leptolyngbya sp. SIO1D8]|nr:DUF2656 domain-containing protein [Leptolyngbya sp. SIO1D8]
MLLSHNFNVSPDRVPALSREEFVAIFQAGLGVYEDLQCQGILHSHWQVEIQFSTDRFSPTQIGELCAKTLADKRISQHSGSEPLPPILILGGLKTTPPTSDSPEALQPGEWGVDVVETPSINDFLQSIAWEATIAQRSPENVFKVEMQAP